jgi:hypothetical protein
MGARSRTKGKVGEREVANRLKAIFPDAKRGIQSRGGGAEIADVIVPHLHVEVKRQRLPNPVAALAQAVADAKPGLWPVAYTRRDHGEWLVTMRADDFEELLGQWVVETGRGR